MPASSARPKLTTPPTMRKSAGAAFSSLSSAAASTVGSTKTPALLGSGSGLGLGLHVKEGV